MMYDEIRREVDRLFAAEAPARFDELCINPVTGGRWVRGYDPIEDQKEEAYRALSARAWFAQVGPKDAPPLPLWGDRETKAGGGLSAHCRVVRLLPMERLPLLDSGL